MKKFLLRYLKLALYIVMLNVTVEIIGLMDSTQDSLRVVATVFIAILFLEHDSTEKRLKKLEEVK